jgi:hypothetical protein
VQRHAKLVSPTDFFRSLFKVVPPEFVPSRISDDSVSFSANCWCRVPEIREIHPPIPAE